MRYYFEKNKYKKISNNIILKNTYPLYDIIRNAIVIVKKSDLIYHIKINYFRLPKKNLLNNNTRFLQILNKYNLKDINLPKILKDISSCKKPSFIYFTKSDKIQHKPYYNKSEIVALSLNNNLIKITDKKVNINKLCEKIQKNQFQKQNILNHSNYIQKNQGMYIIRYYTFVGDAFMNSYLRNLDKSEYLNDFLIHNIKLLWKLISNAPSFSKTFSVYRRIGSDFLSHLKIGDIYLNNSFMSTTRDPFYKPEGFTFGNIILKINIPKDKKGCGLMTELYSHFPQELEVLLPPNISLKLINKNFKFYHSDKSEQKTIKTTYEFDLVKIHEIKIPKDRLVTKPTKRLVLSSIRLSSNNLQNKINTFLTKYSNKNMQFETYIGEKIYLFYIYIYDSTSVYKDLYKYKTSNGVSIIYQNKKNSQICLFLELGPIMHVNYHLNYYDYDNCPAFIDYNKINTMQSVQYLNFLKLVAHTFRINKIMIYANRVSCSYFYKNVKNKDIYTQFLYRNITFDKDLYDLLKTKNHRFSYSDKIKSTYKYVYLLDKEIPEYMTNMNSYKQFKKQKKPTTLKELYLFILKNKPIKIRKYENIITKYIKRDIFNGNYFVIDVPKYLEIDD
jgi:hypothetical protein